MIHRKDGEEREEGSILWEACPDADRAEGREENISPQITGDTEEYR